MCKISLVEIVKLIFFLNIRIMVIVPTQDQSKVSFFLKVSFFVYCESLLMPGKPAWNVIRKTFILDKNKIKLILIRTNFIEWKVYIFGASLVLPPAWKIIGFFSYNFLVYFFQWIFRIYIFKLFLQILMIHIIWWRL